MQWEICLFILVKIDVGCRLSVVGRDVYNLLRAVVCHRSPSIRHRSSNIDHLALIMDCQLSVVGHRLYFVLNAVGNLFIYTR
jgi:hypothetical protein